MPDCKSSKCKKALALLSILFFKWIKSQVGTHFKRVLRGEKLAEIKNILEQKKELIAIMWVSTKQNQARAV